MRPLTPKVLRAILFFSVFTGGISAQTAIHLLSVKTIAGATNTGSDDGAGAAARFNGPQSVAADGAGNVYVADTGNNVIRKIDSTGLVTTFAGTAGQTGSADGTGPAAFFRTPVGVAVDRGGNVYIADAGNSTIRKITPAGTVSTLAGSPGNTGSVDGTGAAARFENPQGLVVDVAGNVFVTDNSTIRKITPAGVVTTVAGTPGSLGFADGTGAAAQFIFPEGIAIDAAGILYVADTNGHTIRKVTQAGVVTTIAGQGGTTGSTDGTGTAARFNNPAAIAIDATGNLDIADMSNDTIRVMTPAGVVTTLAGTAGIVGTADGTGPAAQFHYPQGIAVGTGGTLYVADRYNSTIRAVSPAGVVSTVAGRGYDLDGAATVAQIADPYAIALDTAGNLYILDSYDNNVRKLTPAGIVTTLAGSAGNAGWSDGVGSAARFYDAQAIAVDGAGNVYVSDGNDIVRKITPDGTVSTLAGLARTPGDVDGTGSAARFDRLGGIAVDAAGNVFVASDFTIRKITPAGVVTTIAGTPGNYGTADGTGSAAQFGTIFGLAIDAAGNLYSGDNYTVRRITPAGVVTTIAGMPGAWGGSADGTGSQARFWTPHGLAVDPAGNIYVADSVNCTIREVTPAGVVATIAGLAGTAGNADGTGGNARLNNPSGLAIDSSGTLWIGDQGNQTIRQGTVATAAPVITSLPASLTVAGGTTASFTVGASGPGPLSYQWSKNGANLSDGGNVSGSATATLTLANVQVADAGSYRVFVSNAAGAIAVIATLAVNGPAPVITVQPASQTVTAGATATFSVGVTSGLTPSFQWQKGGTAISGATASTYTVEPVSAADIGAYSVVISNATGKVTSSSAILSVNPATPPTPVYSLVDLGTLGGRDSQAFAMNASGQVAGSSVTILGGTDAFLYTAGQMIDLSALGSPSAANAINDSGQVAGFAPATNPAPPPPGTSYTSYLYLQQVFLYSGGVMTLIGAPANSNSSVATGINDSGQIAITAQTNGPIAIVVQTGAVDTSYGAPFAVLFTGGKFQALAPALAGSWTAGINAAGQVVGSAILNGPSAYGTHAYLFSNGQALDLGTLGGLSSAGYGINALGDCVGQSFTANSATHAFLYTGGAMKDLGTLPGDLNSSAAGINTLRQVVGSSTAGSGVSRAFLYAGGAMADLNQLVLLSNGSVPGLVYLSNASTINDSGQIAGSGIYFDEMTFRTHAFILTPIVPPSIVSQSPNKTVTAGGTATFTASAVGTTSFTYQWMKNGAAIAGATGASYTVAAAQLTDAGIYSVAISNSAGSVTSGPMGLSVTFTHGATYLDSWTYATPFPSGSTYDAIAFDGTNYIAVSSTGVVSISADAVHWSAAVPAIQTWGRLNSIISLGGQGGLVAVGDGGAIVTLSGPSYVATQQVSGTANLLTDVAAGNGLAVAVGYSGTILVSDYRGITWIPAVSGTVSNLNSVAFGAGVFVAVGQSGSVVTSTDGIHWAVQSLGTAANLVGVAYGSGSFAAISDAGAIFTSGDGTVWTLRYPPVIGFSRITYANGIFATIGHSGETAVSIDGGQTWQLELSVIEGLGITFGNGKFVAVGQFGQVAQSALALPARLANLSARANAGTGSSALVAGLVTAGTSPKKVLLRGVGPTLASYGLGGVLANPQLALFDTSGRQTDFNGGWGGAPALAQLFTQLGAFALPAASADTALAENLTGAYTLQISGAGGTAGLALAEVYDASLADPSSRLVNLSARAGVGIGAQKLIAGFVISGNTEKTVLLRAIGPGLAPYNISGVISDPRLILFDAANHALEANIGWHDSPALAQAFSQTGAFALPAHSSDSAILVTLPPGSYTAQVDSASGAAGTALVEVYEAP